MLYMGNILHWVTEVQMLYMGGADVIHGKHSMMGNRDTAMKYNSFKQVAANYCYMLIAVSGKLQTAVKG